MLADVGIVFSEHTIKSVLNRLKKGLNERDIETRHFVVTGLEVDRSRPAKEIRNYSPDYTLILNSSPAPAHTRHGGYLTARVIDNRGVLLWDMSMRATVTVPNGAFGARIAEEILGKIKADDVFTNYDKGAFF